MKLNWNFTHEVNLLINSISCTSLSFQPNHEKLEAKVNELKKAQMEAKNRAKGLSSDHGTPRDSSRQCKLFFFCSVFFFAQYLYVEYVFWISIFIQTNWLFSYLQFLQKTWVLTQPYYPLWSGSKQRMTNTQRMVLCKYCEHCSFCRKIWYKKTIELHICSCTYISEETMWKHQDPEVEEG